MRPIQITPVTATISAILAVTMLLPMVVLATVIKWFVRCLVKAIHGKNADLVPGRDVVHSAKFMGTVDSLLNSVTMIGGPVEVDLLKNRVAENLVNVKNPDGSWLHPRLRASFLWFLGYRIMVIDRQRLNLDRHFECLKRVDGKPVVCESEGEVEDILEEIAHQEIFPGDPEAPPWKYVIFYSSLPPSGETSCQGLGGTNGGSVCADDGNEKNRFFFRKTTTYMVIRLNHMIADGASMFMTFLQQTSDPETHFDPPTDLFRGMRPLRRSDRYLMDLKGFLLSPLTTFRSWFPGNGFGDNNPLKARGGPREGRYFVFPKVIPLEKLKAIREATEPKAKISAILASCLTRSIHRICKDIAKKDMAGEAGRPLAPKWSCTCYIAYMLWATGDPIAFKNRFVGLPYTCTSKEFCLDDPLKHSKMIERTVQEPSSGSYAWSLGCMTKMLFDAVPVALWSPFLAWSAKSATAAFSNVRGPTAMPQIGGYDLKQAAFMNLWEGVGLGLAAVSYGDEVMLAFVGKKAAFRTRDELRLTQAYFLDEVDLLHKAAVTLSFQEVSTA